MEKAKQALEKFMKAWQTRNWHKTYKLSQITWKHDYSIGYLEKLLGKRDFDSFKILNGKKTGSCSYTFRVKMKTEVGELVILPNIFQESAPYKPSETGVWGVNPISTAKLENADK